MAGYSTTYYDKKIIDHSTGVAPWTPPTTLYIALSKVVLTRFNTTMPAGIEMSGSGYHRATVASGATLWGAAAVDTDSQVMTAKNIVAITHGTATADWPALPGWSVLDDPIAGNVLWCGPYTQQVGFALSGQTAITDVGFLQLAVAGATT